MAKLFPVSLLASTDEVLLAFELDIASLSDPSDAEIFQSIQRVVHALNKVNSDHHSHARWATCDERRRCRRRRLGDGNVSESIGPVTGRLPAEVTSFIGRAAEVAQAGRLLGRSRLVTLTGVGGVGKTRLAVQVARHASAGFRDGIRLVELSVLRDSALVPHVIGSAVELNDQASRPQLDVLAEFLADKQLLLVLDGCEQLIDACARTAQALLRAAPELRIIVTSRQPLGIAGERTLAVPPLPVPDREGPQAHSDAVALFADRASAAVPGFAVTRANLAGVAEVCRRLDGIPLAIELAAVQLHGLSVDQLLIRLADRFRLLGGGHAVLPRHQTLRTTIGWSHELCAPPERLLWARLSVFAGSFDLEAAQGVAVDEWVSAAEVELLVGRLVDKSILLRDEDAAGVRFRLLDTIAEYGRDWLQTLGEERRQQVRHCDYYLALAQRADARWLGPGQVEWYQRIVREHANLRAAMDFALSDPDHAPAALGLAGNLSCLWFIGEPREGGHYLTRALAHATKPSAERAKALCTLALVEIVLGDSPAAYEHAEQAREEAAGLGERSVMVDATALHAGAAVVVTGARKAAELIISTLRHGGPRTEWSIGPLVTQGGLGLAFLELGDPAAAIRWLTEVRDLCIEHQELVMRSHFEWVLGAAYLARGDAPLAVAQGQAALKVKRMFRDRIGIVLIVELLATATAAQGRGEVAARLHGAAALMWRDFTAPFLDTPSLIALHNHGQHQARELIGDLAYETEFQRGTELDLDEAIDYALNVAPNPAAGLDKGGLQPPPAGS